jgi:hypothetical protein
MFPLLYKYLMLNDQVCIPGVGRFLKQRQAAAFNFSNKVFEPPIYTISFREEPVSADKKFYAFVSKEQGIEEVDAVRKFNDFAYEFKHHLTHHNQTQLPGFGLMKRNAAGEIVFEEASLVNNYFPSTAAERIVRENSEHQILVGDTERTNAQMQVLLDDGSEPSVKKRWWIGAAVLALLAIAAIVYYYLQHGNVRL